MGDLEGILHCANKIHCCVILWPNPTAPAFSTGNFGSRTAWTQFPDCFSAVKPRSHDGERFYGRELAHAVFTVIVLLSCYGFTVLLCFSALILTILTALQLIFVLQNANLI